MIGRPRIAVALSGGGFRASLFHLGTLRRLAEAGWLDRVDVVSTVSGGSIVGGFAVQRWSEVLAAGGTAEAFCRIVVSPFLDRIQSRNFIKDWVLQWWKIPFHKADRTYTRTKLAAELYGKRFYESKTCSSLPESPLLIINAAALVSIRAWRFSRCGMGDSRVGHTAWGAYPLSIGEAVGASAAFPPVFTPSRIRRADYDFSGPLHGEAPLTLRPVIPLTDGGVYDNMGLEVLTKESQIPVKRTLELPEFLMVSDAGYPPQYQFRNSGIPGVSEALLLFRVDDIARTQVGALRKRQLISQFANAGGSFKGSLVMLGSKIDKIGQGAADQYFSAVGKQHAIPVHLIKRIDCIRTHLDRFFPVECEALMYHAYTMADAFLWHYRKTLPAPYQVPNPPSPEWRIEFTAQKVSEWEKGLKKSHKRRILWPR